MIRRLLVGAVILVATAGLFSVRQQETTAVAAPSNVIGPISFGTGVNDQAQVTGEAIEFGSDPGTIWASFQFGGIGPGTKLSFVLQLNGEDYAWGPILGVGNTSSGRIAIPLTRPSDGGSLPGGAYRLTIYEGMTEVGRGGFGIRGGGGADNGNAPSNSHGGDDDDDD